MCLGLLLAGSAVGVAVSADRMVSLAKLAAVAAVVPVFLVLRHTPLPDVILSEAKNLPRLWESGPAGKILRRLRLLRMTWREGPLPWALLIAGVAASLAGNVLIDRNAWKLNALNRPVYQAFAHIPRFSDVAINQNALAAFLVLVIPFGAALAFESRLRWLARVLTLALLFELLLTDSRAAMLSLAASSSLLVVLTCSRWRWLWLAAPMFAAGSVAAGALGVPSTGERLGIWQSALYMLADHPVTGIGLGMFQRVYPHYMLPAFHNTQPHAHNLFLQTWLDMGVLGAMGIVTLVVLVVAAILRLAQRPKRPAFAIAAAVSSLAVLLQAQVDAYFAGDPRTYWVMFIPLALLIAAAGPLRAPNLAWGLIALPLLLVPLSRSGWLAERRLGLETGNPQLLQAALDDGPKTELAHFELAQALHARGDDAGAIPEWRLAHAAPYLVRHGMYDLALAVDPDDPEAREGLLWTPVRPLLPLDRAGRAAELAGDDAQARRDYEALSQTDPVGYYRLGELDLRRGSASRAVGQLEQAVRAIPNQEDFRLGLARAYVQAGEAGKARQEYQAVLDLDPGAGAGSFRRIGVVRQRGRFFVACGSSE